MGRSPLSHVGKSAGLSHRLGQSTILPLRIVDEQFQRQNSHRVGMNDQSSAIVRSLLEKMHIDDDVPLYVAGVDGKLVYVNDGYRKLVLRCDRSETSALRTSPQRNDTMPPSLAAVLNEVQLVRHSISIEEKLSFGENLRQFRSRHFPICDNQGKIVAVGGTYIDCTEQLEVVNAEHEMQQRFRDFARATSDWFFEIGRDYQVTYLSERITAITGKPAILFKGQPLDQMGYFADRPGGERLSVYAKLDEYKPFRDLLFVIQDSEGQELLMHLSGVPLFDKETGEFKGFRGAGMDMSSSYQAQNEARKARKELEKTLQVLTNKNTELDMANASVEASLEAKNEFLAAMSHELRTPLNAIIGFAEAMKMEVFGDLNSQYVSYSNDIMNAGTHLLGLINDVLDVAVLESGKIKLETSSTSLGDILSKAMNLVVMQAEDKEIDMSGISLDHDWHVLVDERRAVQIFVNLFSNAVKFTEEGGQIGVWAKTQAHNLLAITVWDTGVGIPQDQQSLIFEKFHQARDDIYSRKQEGTGLGLHISRELARMMHGDITLTSKAGKGSEFTVLLPMV